MKFGFFMGLLLVCCASGKVWALSEDQRPDYQKEYDAYLKDLQFIEQKGYAPKNSILEDDLAKMSSEKRIRLTNPSAHSFNKKYPEQLKVAENDSEDTQAPKSDAKVVSRVEIIRVPEEFREQYANIYAEETKHISAQSLAKDQEEERQRALQDEEALKIAEHDNPFRLLKEKDLETIVPAKKNSVTDAYFKEQKRAFVAGKPIIIEKKEVKKAENEVENVVAESSEPNVSAQAEPTPKYRAKSRVYHVGPNGNNSSSSSTSLFGRGVRASNMFLE